MALTSVYTVAIGRISDLFKKIRDGQAPDQFTIQLLKDWGFKSSNDRAFLPLLEALGFLSPDGKPTNLYHEYRDHSRSEAVMGQALRNAYGDIFLIKEHPTDTDKTAVQGKFKSYHNVSDNVASLMAKTFYGLLKLADLKGSTSNVRKDGTPKSEGREVKDMDAGLADFSKPDKSQAPLGSLHYNIQIHLPATKDIEVYNAIFKSLKGHIFAR